MRYFLRYLISAANDLLAIPLVVLIHLVWGENLRMEGPCICTDLKPDSWPVDPSHAFPFAGWYEGWAGTTFGHAIVYGVAPTVFTKMHECVHVEQCEAAMLKSLLIGLLVLLFTGKLWLSYSIWSFGYAFYLLGNWVVAAIRGEDSYSGSAHEEHAYAVTKVKKREQQDAQTKSSSD